MTEVQQQQVLEELIAIKAIMDDQSRQLDDILVIMNRMEWTFVEHALRGAERPAYG